MRLLSLSRYLAKGPRENRMKSFLVIVSIVSLLFTGCLIKEHTKVTNNIHRIAVITQKIALSPAEKAAYDDALGECLYGKNAKMDAWIAGLVKAERFGVLPGLPEEYTNPCVVSSERTKILVKPEPPVTNEE